VWDKVKAKEKGAEAPLWLQSTEWSAFTLGGKQCLPNPATPDVDLACCHT